MTQHFISMSLSGDVGTKATATRRAFQRRLRANLKDTLARHGHGGRIRDRRDRIDIEGLDRAAVEPLTRVFGIQSVRAVRALPWEDLDDIVAAGERLYRDAVAGRRFAVRPRRLGPREQVRISSEELARRLGRKLVKAGGRVDLDAPEVTVRVEVRPHDVLFFDQATPGPGGLPIGVEGHALALMSGGFDSAVAAWQMLRRGVELEFLLFNLAGWPQEQAVRQLLEHLDRHWMGGTRTCLHIVDFRPVVADLRQYVRSRYWQVLLKRLMMRAADQVAHARGSQALVTGEAIGQVSSQTLTNLGAIGAHTRTPVLRPLLGQNKQEIVDLAHRIGTAGISAGVEEFCALDGAAPATRVRTAELDRQEDRIGRALIETLARRYRTVPRTAFGDALGDSPEVERVPDHVAVFDLRSEAEYREWCWPDAIHMEFDRAMELAGRLPRDRAYLFYCEVGLKSAHLAEMMREAGYEAYSFRGGVRPMQEHARLRDTREDQPA